MTVVKKLKITIQIAFVCLILHGCGILGESESFREKLVLSELNGDQILTDQYNEKILILNLWATWCKPCIAEMPSLVKMIDELPADKFELLLVSGEEVTEIKDFIDKRGYDLNFVATGMSLESMGAYSLPTTLIIGKEGELLETIVGGREWDDSDLIKKLLAYSK